MLTCEGAVAITEDRCPASSRFGLSQGISQMSVGVIGVVG
jgi:hypothetical protein